MSKNRINSTILLVVGIEFALLATFFLLLPYIKARNNENNIDADKNTGKPDTEWALQKGNVYFDKVNTQHLNAAQLKDSGHFYQNKAAEISWEKDAAMRQIADKYYKQLFADKQYADLMASEWFNQGRFLGKPNMLEINSDALWKENFYWEEFVKIIGNQSDAEHMRREVSVLNYILIFGKGVVAKWNEETNIRLGNKWLKIISAGDFVVLAVIDERYDMTETISQGYYQLATRRQKEQ